MLDPWEIKHRFERLTPRELELFWYLAGDGLANKQAAARMGVCERTVKAHRQAVMQKLGAVSVIELVKMAIVINPALVGLDGKIIPA